MASVGDRVVNPGNPTDGAGAYAAYESTNETPANGVRQAALLVKIVGDDGSTSAPATAPNQTTGNTSLSSIDTKLSGTGSVKDNGPGWTSVRGVAGIPFTSADASGADAPVTDAPTLGQKLVITDVEISVDTAMRVDLKEETSGDLVGRYFMAANSTLQVTTRGKKKLAVANKKLMVRTSVAGNVAVTANYYSE